MPDSSPPPEPNADEPLEHLLTLAQRQLLNRLFRTYYAKSCAYASYQGAASPEDAEDIVQQTFLSLVAGHQCLSSPEGESAVLKYIYATIDGRVKNAWRDDGLDQRYREHDVESVQAIVGPIAAPPPDTALLAAEMERVLVRVVQVLPPPPRRILVLKRQGYTYLQIAELLHLSPSTVNGHMVRALGPIRQALREWRDGKRSEKTIPKDTPPKSLPPVTAYEPEDTIDEEDTL